jgi:hypothetical protein
LIDLKLNDQRQSRETSIAPGARCGGEGAAHRNKNADVAVRCTFNLALCLKATDVLAALPLGVGLILVVLILKF